MSTATHTAQPRADVAEIRRCLELFHEPGEIIEIRALKIPGRGQPHEAAGYFDNPQQAGEAAAQLDARHAAGVYHVLNVCNPALLARARNRVLDHLKPVTGDNDVMRRRWLPLDFDATRPAGISATDDERGAAEALAQQCAAWLSSRGWPAPIIGDSGNGAQLLYRIDLPTDDSGLVQHCLQALAERFDTAAVKVDRSVHNPARIWKLYGTRARKGDSTPDRPHRISRLIKVPEAVGVVPLDKLKALAATASKPEPSKPSTSGDGQFTSRLDVPRYLTDRGIEFHVKQQTGRTLYLLRQCPFDQNHGGQGEVAVIQGDNGALSFECKHNSCQGRGWQEFKQAVGPPEEHHYDPPLTGRQQQRQDRRADKTPKCSGQNRGSITVTAYTPFPLQALPEPAAGFVQATAEAIGCDAAFVALPLLSALAGGIGNTYRVQLKRGWSEPAVLWIGVVAESGTGKSPALQAVMAPLERREAAAAREYAVGWADHERLRLQYEKDLAAWKRGGREQQGEPPEAPHRPTCERYLVSDITCEALASCLSENPRGVLVARDELAGWLLSFGEYKGRQQGSDLPNWLSMHNAGPVRVDRKTGEQKRVYIPHAAVSVTGGIQPQTLRRLLTPQYFDCGLAARLLLAMPPRQARRWRDSTVPEKLSHAMDQVFGNLLTCLQPAEDEHGQPCRHEIPLTAEGQKCFERFYNEHAREQHESTSGDLAALWSKLEAAAARFGLIHHLVRFTAGDSTVDPDAVDHVSVAAGITLARWFGAEGRRVYAVLGETEEETERRELVELIDQRGGRITSRDLARTGGRRYRAPGAAEAALEQLVKVGVGCWTVERAGDQGGRPSDVFELICPGDGDKTLETPQKTGVLSPSPEQKSGNGRGSGDLLRCDLDHVNDLLAAIAAEGES